MPSTSALNLLSIPNDRAAEPLEKAPHARRERRETESAYTYWEQIAARMGHAPTLMNLDVAELTTDEWAYRFIISLDAIIENSALLIYGRKFAQLLNLPAKPVPHVPMIQQLPKAFVPPFIKGCTKAATTLGAPVHMEGAVAREDDRVEIYRALFIAFEVKPASLTHLAFGAFNSTIRDRQP
jgi:hypothetical protein